MVPLMTAYAIKQTKRKIEVKDETPENLWGGGVGSEEEDEERDRKMHSGT